MSITRDDVLRVAQLAELAVSDEELPGLVSQMERIVSFVEQLSSVHDDTAAGAFVAGPSATPLREDVVQPAKLAHPISQMAPEFIDGFFAVPLRGTLADDS